MFKKAKSAVKENLKKIELGLKRRKELSKSPLSKLIKKYKSPQSPWILKRLHPVYTKKIKKKMSA